MFLNGSGRLATLIAAVLLACSTAFVVADDQPATNAVPAAAAAPAATAAPAASADASAADPNQAPAIELADSTAPDVAKGKRVFQVKANCVYCHGWPGDGMTGKNPRSPGIAANLRQTQLDPNTMIQIVSCGIPGSAMPYHDSQAYKDARCYGTTAKDYTPDQMPTPGHFLTDQDIVNVVAYVQQKIKGRGPITKAECEEYFDHPNATACRLFK